MSSSIYGYTTLGLGIMVLYGWIKEIAILTSIMPFWVTMKPLTAVNFILCSFIALTLTRHLSKVKEFLLSTATIGILGITLITFFSSLIGRDLFHFLSYEEGEALLSVAPNVPSLGTAIAFMLSGLTGLACMFNSYRIADILGFLVSSVGFLGVLGYVFNLPILFYYIEGFSSAMAVHTAVGFILLGLALRVR